jgi:tetraacyldisaccharide 4'-kinase
MSPNRWLEPLSSLYGQVMRLRNFCYDRQWLKTTWLDVPVISVGNMTTGGTGKTPMVIFLAQLAAEAGIRPGIVLRGYGGTSNHEADEVLLLRRELPGLPVIANPDRIAGGRHAIEQSAGLLIADDAFQHRRLGRDLNICLVDACFPFGGGKILPAGRLREPMEGFSRADVVILTRCDQINEQELGSLKSQIEQFAGPIPILTSNHRVKRYVDSLGNVKNPVGGRVFAFAAIGRSESFFNTVRETGVTLVGTRSFPDHYYFTADDLKEVQQQAFDDGAEFLVCTAKDIVKINPSLLSAAGISPEKLTALEIEIAMPNENVAFLRDKIREVAARVPKRELS